MKNKRQKWHSWILQAGLFLLSLTVLVPLLMVVLGSFKTPIEAGRFDLRLPEKFIFSNYAEVFKKGHLGIAFKNSMVILLSVVPVTVMISAPAAFVLARRNMFRLYNYMSLVVFFPVSIIPSIVLMKQLNLQGTIPGIILLYIGLRSSWAIFLLTGFARTIPKELDEAALIDGCSPLKMFFSVIFPVMKPGITTCIVIISMWTWNEFQLPLYFLGSGRRTTLPMTVYYFFGRSAGNWNLVFADVVLAALPVALLYLFCQKYIVSGMTAGAVKG